MPVPTHDITCNSRAFQTNCPSCSADVWFYSCSCGSKVFFDRLGHPWDIHECLQYRLEREIDLIRNSHYMTAEEIYNFIIKHEKRSGSDVDEKIWVIIEQILGKRKSKLTIETVEPYNGLTDVSGKVMIVNMPINIFSRLGYYGNNEISRKLLGKTGDIKWGYAKIRTTADRKNACLEFEVLFKSQYLTANPLRKDDFIVGIAQSLKHPKGLEWELVKHDKY